MVAPPKPPECFQKAFISLLPWSRGLCSLIPPRGLYMSFLWETNLVKFKSWIHKLTCKWSVSFFSLLPNGCIVNFLNIRTPKKFVVNTLKFELWLYHRVMSPNDADGMTNSVDPDQTARSTVCPGISARKFRIIMVSVVLSYTRYGQIIHYVLNSEALQ